MTSAKFSLTGNFDKFSKWANDKASVAKMQDRVARSVIQQGYNNVSANMSGNRTGRLRQSLNIGATEAYWKIDIQDGLTVAMYGTTVPYAAAMEYGYDQKNRVSKATGNKPSLWIPGYWQSDTFVYVPGYPGGMLLTGRIVEGQHMWERSIPETLEDLQSIILAELRRLWGGVS